MSRVFDDWYLSLTGEERRAYDQERSAQEDAGREEWEAANPERVPRDRVLPEPYDLDREIPF